jgi:hypothetical protein
LSGHACLDPRRDLQLTDGHARVTMRPRSQRPLSSCSTKLAPARRNTRQSHQGWPLTVIRHSPSTNDLVAPCMGRTRLRLASTGRRHMRRPSSISWRLMIGRSRDIYRFCCGEAATRRR